LRKRLRITLIGDREQILEPALELHRQQLKYPEYRFFELVSESNHDGDHPLVEVIEHLIEKLNLLFIQTIKFCAYEVNVYGTLVSRDVIEKSSGGNSSQNVH